MITDKQTHTQTHTQTDRISSCRLDPLCRRGRVKKENCCTTEYQKIHIFVADVSCLGFLRLPEDNISIKLPPLFLNFKAEENKLLQNFKESKSSHSLAVPDVLKGLPLFRCIFC